MTRWFVGNIPVFEQGTYRAGAFLSFRLDRVESYHPACQGLCTKIIMMSGEKHEILITMQEFQSVLLRNNIIDRECS